MNHEENIEFEAGEQHWADAFRDATHSAAERPPHFWTAQRAGIREKIRAKSRSHSAWLAFAYTTALCILALLLVSDGKAPLGQTGLTAHTHSVATSLSDQELMADVEATLNSSLPDALAPTDILAQEINSNLQVSNTNTKGSRQ